MKNLEEIILSDPLISKVFASGPEVFIVGGYLRDLLRGVRSRDIDLVVRGDIRRLVQKLFRHHVSIIEFRKAPLVRVVRDDYVLDFTELRGDIEEDLRRRDFTMNAVAWSPGQGILDPLSGVADIKRGLIRGVSEKNFTDDPLRLLRAYRFAGELGWNIDYKTRITVRKLKYFIKFSATERITLEILKLLNSEGCLKALRIALTDGMLDDIISLNNKKLENNIKALSRLNSFLKKIPEAYISSLNKEFSQGLSYLGLLRAEQLLLGSDLGKNNLKLSSATFKRLKTTADILDAYEKSRGMDDAQLFDLFSDAKDAVMDFALLTRRQRILSKAERFTSSAPLLPTAKVMEMSGLEAGPELGVVLKEMRKLQFLGRINNEGDAGKWLISQVSRSDRNPRR